MKKIVLTLTLFLLGTLFSIAQTNPGDLDITFGNNGKLQSGLGFGGDNIWDLVVQSDGKIVITISASVAGSSSNKIIRLNSDGTEDKVFDKAFNSSGNVLSPFHLAIDPSGKIFAICSGNVLIKYNADGTLDSSFGTGGVGVEVNDGIPRSLAIQPDGKIVSAGIDYTSSSTSYDYFLVRFNIDGTLDISFDSDGIVRTVVTSQYDYLHGLKIHSNGKIVVAGYTRISNVPNIVAVVYNSDGSLDTGFDGDGMKISTFGTNGGDARAVDIQSDGKIILAGYSGTTRNEFTTIRLNTDGSMDNSFDGDGMATTSFNSGNWTSFARGVSVQSDGKIIVCGHFYDPSGGTDFAVAKYNPDGSLDTSFESDGLAKMQITTESDDVEASFIQNDGKIVLAGTGRRFSQNDSILARFNSDGSPDSSFDGDGKWIKDYGHGEAEPHAAVMQSDSKIVVAGTSKQVVSNSFISDRATVVRYNSDGSFDTSFGTNGISTFPVTRAYDVSIQSDGKILAVGDSFTIARFNSNGILDTSFNSIGYVTSDIGTNSETALAVAVQPDGKIIVGGNRYDCTSSGCGDAVFVRYNSDGSIDTTFGANGIAVANFTNRASISDLKIASDGKVVGFGTYSCGSYTCGALTRINTDGTIDSSFNSGNPVYTIYPRFYGDNLVIQSDGKIIIVGGSGSRYPNAVINRFNTDGTLDSSFGSNGTVSMNYRQGFRSVGLQSDGRIIVGGYYNAGNSGSTNDFFVARLNTDGTFDNSFWSPENSVWGNGGIVTTDVSGIHDYINAIVIDSFDNVIAVGETNNLFGLSKYSDGLGPTAANVSVGGRIITKSGRGVGRIIITMTDANGITKSVRSNPFGHFSFKNVEVGQTYVFTVRAKGRNFEEPTQIINVEETLTDLNFIVY